MPNNPTTTPDARASTGARPRPARPALAALLAAGLAPATAPPGAGADEVGGAGEFAAVVSTYGIIRTVAGTGTSNRGSFWTASMEGRPGNQVELSRPHMAMADAAGNIFIADKEAHGIRRIATDGTVRTVVGVVDGVGVAGDGGDGPGTSVALSNPNGLYTLPDGTTYILDLDNSKIRRLGTDGNVVTVFTDNEGIALGRGLWVSPDEAVILFASGTRLRRWTATGGITTLSEGFVQLGNIDVAPDGSILASDRFGYRVYRVLPDGSRTVVAGNGSTFGGGNGQRAVDTALDEVRAVAAAPTGGFYVATHRGGQLWYVDAAGVIHLLVDGDDDRDTYSGDGLPITQPGRKISEPRAVTIAPNGDLIITENDLGHIRVVESVCPPVSFADWAAAGGVSGGAGGDDDGDGVPNLLAFALGADLAASGSGAVPALLPSARVERLPSGEGAEDFVTFRYRLRFAAAVDVRVELSDDLVNWSSAGQTVPLGWEDNADGTQTLTVRAAEPIAPGSGARFARLAAGLR